ncbi:MAG: peptide chain release factor N(5)-glutamine methyltransferase [Chthonomonadaceae bacterium]|nr:peptide chain release factor N(5)-glutamine methyltransferase [Chthonomonadaceae bacterium]
MFSLEEATRKLSEAEIESPRFEAQLLLMIALGVTRTQVLAGTYLPPTYDQETRFMALIEARTRRIPFAYLRGSQEFYGLEFVVSPSVLIPRPETESLVERVLEVARKKDGAFRFADVGTGTGCIPISILANTSPNVSAIAIDLSPLALEIALTNAKRHGVLQRVELLQTDLLQGVEAHSLDFIVSNPPYIETETLNTLEPEVRDHEPRLALDGGEDGLQIYRRLFPEIARVLKPKGSFAVEVGAGQAPAVSEIAERAGFQNLRVSRDFADIERVVEGELP